MMKLWNHKGRLLLLQVTVTAHIGIKYIGVQKNLLLQATGIRYKNWP